MRPENNGLHYENYNGFAIALTTDTYFDATALCKANGKKFNDYHRLAQTTAFLEELSLKTGIPAIKLVETTAGRYGSTFVHRRVAVNLGQWASPQCAVWVSGVIEELLTKGQVSLPGAGQPKPEPPMFEVVDALMSRGMGLKRAYTMLVCPAPERKRHAVLAEGERVHVTALLLRHVAAELPARTLLRLSDLYALGRQAGLLPAHLTAAAPNKGQLSSLGMCVRAALGHHDDIPVWISKGEGGTRMVILSPEAHAARDQTTGWPPTHGQTVRQAELAERRLQRELEKMEQEQNALHQRLQTHNARCQAMNMPSLKIS